jgi:magnesium-transporting ATPase (P-type)
MHVHRLARRLIQAVVPATPSEPALTDPPKPGGKAILDDCDIHFVPLRWSAKTGTLTAGVMQFERATDPIGAASPRPLTLAISTVDSKRGIRSPLDAAILRQAAADVAGYRKIDEIPFDFERRLSVVVEAPGFRSACAQRDRRRPGHVLSSKHGKK